MSHVEEINQLDELLRWRHTWNALLQETPGANFFQTLDWLEVYWRHFGAGQRLRVLVVTSRGEPIGVLPLVVKREATRIGSLRTLTWPLDGWGTFYGPIGADPTATLTAGMRHIRQTRRDWDVIDLRWLHPDHDGQRTANALHTAGLPCQSSTWAPCGLIDLQGGWADYWAKRTSKFRNNVRRSVKKLAGAGEARYERFRPQGDAYEGEEPAANVFDTCAGVARNSWQGDSRTGSTLSHDAVHDFAREAHLVAARAGAVDVHLLWLNDRPVAFVYNYHLQGAVYGLRIGFDANVSRDGAGVVLLRHAIEASFASGDQTYDLGPDYLHCKRHWTSRVVHSRRCCHYAWPAPRAQALRLKRAVNAWFAPVSDVAAVPHVAPGA